MTDIANESELHVERGGPAYRLSNRLTESLGFHHAAKYRILGFLAITWVPLLCFALLEGRALGTNPRLSLLMDFGTYARFFLAVPLLIVAESIVGPRLTGAGLNFLRGGFLRTEDYPVFNQAIARVAKSRESNWAELALLAIAMTAPWFIRPETAYDQGEATWRSPISVLEDSYQLSSTGLWYRLVALPILQFFFYRWLWRLFIWGRFLGTVSRLKLNLVATHADQAGGLGFLGTAHSSLGIFAFALSGVLSSEAAFALVMGDAKIEAFQMPFITLIVIVQLMFLGPLLMFCPILIRTRLAALGEYSLLVDRYNRAFHDKWIAGNRPAEEPFLGTADIQSLADLGGSFEYIRNMKAFPFSTRVMLQMAVVTGLPCLPLLLLVMPVKQIIQLLAGALF
jgi:hypothetical protein